jgi:Ca2+-binding RTX toxin-like protein
MGSKGTNDVLEGGSGNDTIRGLSGSDTYFYNFGDGDDTIIEGSASADSDRLILGENLLRSNIIVERSATDQDDVTLRFTGLSGSLLLDEQLYNTGYGIEEIVFGDGTTWSWQRLKQEATGSVVTSGNDSLFGVGGVDDTLEGLEGDDNLYGYSGSDTYVYEAGDGNDTIFEGASNGDTDSLQLGGIIAADVIAVRSSLDLDDVTLQIGGSAPGSIVLDEQFSASAGSGIEEIVFADNTVWTKDDIQGASLLGAKTAGDDVIRGFEGRDDNISGGAGNDQLYGYSGSDTYIVNVDEGNDTIFEVDNAGDIDTVAFGAGTTLGDLVIGRAANDQFDMVISFTGHAGSVRIDQQLDSRYNIGVEGVVLGDSTSLNRSDLLKIYGGMAATAGNDTYTGNSSWLTGYFWGKGGDDLLMGSSSSVDYYYYDLGDGHDDIHDGSSILILGPGILPSNVVVSRDPNDNYSTILTFSDGGTVRIDNTFNYAGVDEVRFANGTVWTEAQIMQLSVMRGTTAGDTLVGTLRDDVIEGGQGDDILEGGRGADTYLYNLGDGNDTIREGNESFDIDRLRLVGIDASDVLVGRNYSDFVLRVVSTGDTIILENQGLAGYGVEEIVFGDMTVWSREMLANMAIIIGTPDDDYLYGEPNASDRFIGGLGDDYLAGYSGSDTYEYYAGDGNDTVDDTGDADLATDTLKLIDLDPADVTLTYDDADLLVTVNSTGHVIRIVGQFGHDLYGAEKFEVDGIEQIVFADATVWDRTDIQTASGFIAPALVITGTAAADTIHGDYWHNTITALGGDDVVFGEGGNDSIDAGDGADTVYGGDGNDAILGGAGDDILFGGEGDDYFDIYAGDGNDTIDGGNGFDSIYIYDVTTAVVADLTQGTITGPGMGTVSVSNVEAVFTDAGDDTLIGSSGNDTLGGWTGNDVLEGAAGDDFLEGDEGDDRYIYNLGDGSDLIQDYGSVTDDDWLVFGTGIGPEDVTVSRDGGTLVLYVETGGDTISIVNGLESAEDAIEEIHFANNVVWTGSDIRAQVIAAQVTSGDDNIDGTGFADLIESGGGNDIIDGRSGDDILRGGDGDDEISGGDGANVLEGGAGNDSLYGGYDDNSLETLRGGAGDDYISGGSGDHIIEGGEGNDEIYTGQGADTFKYSSGDGSDVIHDFSGLTTVDDILQLTDLDSDEITLGRLGDDLLISIASTGSTISIDDQFYSAFSNYGVEYIEFADSIVWNRADIDAKAVLLQEEVWGTSSADNLIGDIANNTIYGFAGDDIIDGLSGNDLIMAGDGDDRITGGVGADTLWGGNGDDVFVFDAGFGQDTIMDFVAGSGTDDVIEFDDAVFADLSSVLAAASQVGADTIITSDASNTITLRDVSKANLHADDFRFV